MSSKNNKRKQAALPMGIALGVSLGTAIGAATDNMGVWLSLGVAIGAGLGTAISAGFKAEEEKEDQENNS